MRQVLQTLTLISLLCLGHVRTVSAQDGDIHTRIDSLIQAGISGLKEEDLTNSLSFCRDYVKQFGEEQNSGIKKRISDVRIFISRIQRQIGSQSSRAAIVELLLALEYDPKNPALHRELGLHYRNIDRFTEARIYLEKAASLDKKDIETLKALVDLNDEKGDVQQKVASYLGYLDVDSTDAEIWTKLGKAKHSLGHETEAKIFFEHALRFDPNQTEARQTLAQIQLKKGEIKEAELNLEAISKSGNVSSIEQSQIAELERQLEKKKRVTGYLKKGISLLNSQSADNWRISISEFRKALEEEPENETARQSIGSALKKLCLHYYEGGKRQEQAGETQLAYEFYTSSLLYAESEEDRDRAFEKQKLMAIKVGKFSGAISARAAADSALYNRRFREALTKYVAAELLDPNLREEISSKRSAAEIGENYERGILAWASNDFETAKVYLRLVMLVNPKFEEVQRYFHDAEQKSYAAFLKSNYEIAKTMQNWVLAHGFLLELSKQDTTDKYGADLIMLEREIRITLFWQYITLVFFSFIGIIASFAWIWKGRKKFKEFWLAIPSIVSWLRDKKVMAGVTAFLFMSFFVLVMGIIFRSKIEFAVPMLMAWANQNQGVVDLISLGVTLITFFLSAAWTFFIYHRYQRAKEKSLELG